MMFNYVDIHTHNPRTDVVSPHMVGVHPWDAASGALLPDFSTCDIIGETGLDYVCEVDRAKQMALFEAHLLAAEELRKPIVLHVVRSFEDVMHMLRRHPALQGVLFHGFIGSVEQAARCLERGYYLSFGARSLRSPRTREVIATTPADRLFVETDDSPTPTIEELYAAVATLRKEDIAKLGIQIEKNYEKLILR